MKIKLTFICLIFAQIIWAQSKHVSFSGDVLTIGVHGRTGCQPPGSTIRLVEGGELEKIMDETAAEMIGTGFVYAYNDEKYIITCAHVVYRAAEIKAYDARYNAYELEFVGEDAFYDLTVLKFKKQRDASKFKSVQLKTSPVIPGTLVWSVGYWNKDGTSNRRVGEVIKTDAMIESDEVVVGKIGFIESTARLLRGYSGGPLYNFEGEVLGMNTKRHNGYDKYYTLQSNILQKSVHEIIDCGGVRRAWLGLRFSQSNTADKAVMIDAVLENSPAIREQSNLLQSQIRKIDGQRVANIYDVLKIMESIEPDTRISLSVRTRNNQYRKIKITPQVINHERLRQIARFAIQENTGDNCIDIIEQGTHVTLIKNDETELNIETVGFRLNEQDYLIYCLNDLVQFGTLTRLLGLYGRLEVDDDKRHYSPLKIRLSPEPEKRVLYY